MAVSDPAEDLATPSLTQFVQLAVETRLEDVHTVSWGSVLAYDRAAQTCSVQIIPRRHYVDADGQAQTERPAPLLNVPVVFPGSGAFAITWPVQPGDVVLLLFMETALDAYMVVGKDDVDSGDLRKHHITDAVAVPGLRPRTAPIPDAGTDSSAAVLYAPALKIGDSTASAPAALNDELATLVSILSTNGTGPGSGDAAIGALQTYLASHTTFPVGSSTTKVK